MSSEGCATSDYSVTSPVLSSKIQPTYMWGVVWLLMAKAKRSFVYWAPRILSILFILFLMLFSLDVFAPGLSGWEIAVGLFMHNIPAFVMTAVLVLSWKREIVGGIAFIAAGLLYIALLLVSAIGNSFEWYMISYAFIIAGPAFVIGVLFLIGWRRKNS